MCGRATLRIVLSRPCMIFASMIEIVIMPRFGTGVNASPLMNRPQCQATRRIGGLLFLTCAASEDGLTVRSSHVFFAGGALSAEKPGCSGRAAWQAAPNITPAEIAPRPRAPNVVPALIAHLGDEAA